MTEERLDTDVLHGLPMDQAAAVVTRWLEARGMSRTLSSFADEVRACCELGLTRVACGVSRGAERAHGRLLPSPPDASAVLA